jgi:ABC-2 type transport system ATP-binding protein
VDTPVIQFEGVSKSFGATAALSDVSWSLGSGQIVALLGPNGAGKTTAIAIMAGIRRPDAGNVRIFGLNPAHPSVRARRAVMLQDCETIDFLTVREAVALFRSYYRTGMDVDVALERAGLSLLAQRRADGLSHGNKQRLFFAQAIVGAPELLFLDEPTVGMDVESRRALHDFIRGLRAGGCTVVLTTHDLAEADELADRVLLLAKGRLVQDASPAQLKRNAHSLNSWIRFRPAASAQLSILREVPGILEARAEGDQLALLVNNPGEVVAALVNLHVPLTDLVVEGPSLEDAFVAMTRGDGA